MAKGMEFLPPPGERKEIDGVAIWQGSGTVYVACRENIYRQKSVRLRCIPADRTIEEVVWEMRRDLLQAATERLTTERGDI